MLRFDRRPSGTRYVLELQKFKRGLSTIRIFFLVHSVSHVYLLLLGFILCYNRWAIFHWQKNLSASSLGLISSQLSFPEEEIFFQLHFEYFQGKFQGAWLTYLSPNQPSWSRRYYALLGPACVACPPLGQGVGSYDWQLHKTIWDA